MGDQLVGVESPSIEGGRKAPFTTAFWASLPAYLEMGMTESAFFEGDPALCKAYREAWKNREKHRVERENWAAWLMGGYVYTAMVLTAPAFNSLKPHKPADYMKKPMELTGISEEKKDDSLFEYMTAFMRRHNKNG